MNISCAFAAVSAVIVTLNVCAVAQQPQNKPLPPNATEVLTRMEREIVTTKTKAISSLEKILKETTKKGDLAGALAVKQEIDRLNAEIKSSARNAVAPPILGRWRGKGWTIEFFPDGSSVGSDGTKGTWTDTGGTIEVNQENGWSHVMKPEGDGYVGVSKNQGKVIGEIRYSRD